MTSVILTMFSTFVAFVAAVIAITEAVNKLFKVEGTVAKLIVSWVLSLALSAVGLALQLGMFSDLGTPDQWQAWVKALLVGVGCALAANKIYDREEIWTLLEWIFSFFKKDGAYIRMKLKEK